MMNYNTAKKITHHMKMVEINNPSDLSKSPRLAGSRRNHMAKATNEIQMFK